MIDREKVIKAVEEAFDLVHSDYIGTYDFDETEWEQNKADALAMLKEQDAVKPEREHSGGGTTWWNVCGNCKTAINPNDKFCHECGKQVKWE